jgi:hypothetical protein
LPRLYLGLHYPTDIIAGATVAYASAFSLRRFSKTSAFESWFVHPLFVAEREYPAVFYTSCFALLFEMGVMFGDVRYALRHANFLFLLAPKYDVLIWAGIFAVLLCVVVIFWRRIASGGGKSEIHHRHTIARLSGGPKH